jgi:uncharacterized membrane protein
MTDTVPQPASPAPSAGPPPSAAVSDERQMAVIIYALHLASFVFGVTSIVALVLAYVNRDTAPDWLKSHYTFQIRTFWIAVAYFAAAFLTMPLLIGFVLVPAVCVWFIVRCAVGLNYLLKNEPYPRPETWTI